jgi:hypothetical protein
MERNLPMLEFRSIQIDLARIWQGRGDAKVMDETRSHKGREAVFG